MHHCRELVQSPYNKNALLLCYFAKNHSVDLTRLFGAILVRFQVHARKAVVQNTEQIVYRASLNVDSITMGT